VPRTVWYPGHMAKGKRKLEELAKKLDLIFEVRDARAPNMTSSPLTESFSKVCPVYIILSRADLAEEGATKAWLHFFKEKKRKVWALNLLEGKIEPLRRDILRLRPPYRELRVAVMGREVSFSEPSCRAQTRTSRRDPRCHPWSILV